jgi:hypothetical protein
MSDFAFEWVVPCAPTVEASVGSTCASQTTADALIPGVAREGSRAVWQLGQVTVADGGSDGLAASEPNGTFAVQGIFVP